MKGIVISNSRSLIKKLVEEKSKGWGYPDIPTPVTVTILSIKKLGSKFLIQEK